MYDDIIISKLLMENCFTNDLDYKFTYVVIIIKIKNHWKEPIHENGGDKFIITERCDSIVSIEVRLKNTVADFCDLTLGIYVFLEWRNFLSIIS